MAGLDTDFLDRISVNFGGNMSIFGSDLFRWVGRLTFSGLVLGNNPEFILVAFSQAINMSTGLRSRNCLDFFPVRREFLLDLNNVVLDFGASIVFGSEIEEKLLTKRPNDLRCPFEVSKVFA